MLHSVTVNSHVASQPIISFTGCGSPGFGAVIIGDLWVLWPSCGEFRWYDAWTRGCMDHHGTSLGDFTADV